MHVFAISSHQRGWQLSFVVCALIKSPNISLLTLANTSNSYNTFNVVHYILVYVVNTKGRDMDHGFRGLEALGVHLCFRTK